HRTGSIVVDCKCFFQPEPSINRTVVERAFQDRTSNATGLWLGSSYQLCPVSTQINPLSPLKSGKENFRLSFRISNLPYSPELQDSRSQMYQENKEKIEKELDVFRASSLKDYFAGCTVENFGYVPLRNVTSTCKFLLNPFSRVLRKQEVYEELKRLTHGFTKLGSSYQLEEQSLVVEGESSCDDFVGMSWHFLTCPMLYFQIVFCLRRKSHLYQVQQGMYGVYFPHLNTRKVH
uniref:SEA domain-containing protein n=1 Tax=Calidris pygmaea TaxID=425635 RepID=A0A8C3KIN7_9CHAR